MDNSQDASLIVARTAQDHDVRVFRTHAFLGDLGNPPYRTARMFAEPTVPVYSEDNRHLGFAGLHWINRRLYAIINIDYASEERLLIETGEKLWAWPVGELTLETPYRRGLGGNGGAGIDLSIGFKVRTLNLHEIVISRRIPANPEVGLIGAKLVEMMQ